MLGKRGESDRQSHEIGGEGVDPERGHDSRRHRADLSPQPGEIEVDERCARTTEHLLTFERAAA